METIISYITEKFIQNLSDLTENFYQDPTKLSDFILSIRKETDELGRKFLESTIQELDEMIKQQPRRKKKWHVEHKADGRHLLTTLGMISFTRTLYTSKSELNEQGRPLTCYLLDQMLGLSPNQEMTDDVKANILKEAVQTSYNKAGKEACSNESVSKESVKNIIHMLQFPKGYQIPEKKKEVEYLYIDADENHYHLQFNEKRGDIPRNERGYKLNGGMTKLAYVFEGIENEAPQSKRHRLVNAHYFARGDEMSSKDFWKEVFDYVETTYDTGKIKKLYINADGGAWIKGGYNDLYDAVFVLDEFHLSKYVARMTSHMLDSVNDAKKEIYDCIREKGKKEFNAVVEKLKSCAESEKFQEKIERDAEYIRSNWMAAKYRLRKKEGVLACSAEGHVYHVLSSRMSTHAMGWSRHGADKMARLREYYCNGGDMYELAKFQKEELPVAAGSEEVILTVREILQSGQPQRTRFQQEYGKYSDLLHASITKQTSQQMAFYLNRKI